MSLRNKSEYQDFKNRIGSTDYDDGLEPMTFWEKVGAGIIALAVAILIADVVAKFIW